MGVHGSIGNQKDDNGTSIDLRVSIRNLSVYVSSTRRFCVVMFDTYVYHKCRMYHVELKMDDFESAAVRLGVFY